MRIRNIKPEFYRSDDIDALSWEQRFLFVALFSYVDDNGVGRDRESDICADLFAGDFSSDPTETLGRVRQGLPALVKRGLLVRYEVDGKRYLFITGWDDHQYVKNPNRERYPRPDKALLQASVDPGERQSSNPVDVTPDLPPVVGRRSLVVGRESLVVGKTRGVSEEQIKSEFDGFWQNYPRKVAKADALKAYRKARNKVDLPVIAAALAVHAEASRRVEPDKVPYPATWLNREPWHDDPAALAPQGKPNSQRQTDDLFAAAAARMTSDRKEIA